MTKEEQYQKRIIKQLHQVETLLHKREEMNTDVSQVPVKWHLDHLLKVIIRILDRLEHSDPKFYQPNFSLSRFLIFLRGNIPRGVAQAPKQVLPSTSILETDICNQLNEARLKLNNITTIEEYAHFTHPRFNQLNKVQTLQFLTLHTQHHLNIITDIVQQTD